MSIPKEFHPSTSLTKPMYKPNVIFHSTQPARNISEHKFTLYINICTLAKIFATHYAHSPRGERGESSFKSLTFYLNGPRNEPVCTNDPEEIVRRGLVTLSYCRCKHGGIWREKWGETRRKMCLKIKNEI